MSSDSLRCCLQVESGAAEQQWGHPPLAGPEAVHPLQESSR